jgi:tryptophanase
MDRGTFSDNQIYRWVTKACLAGPKVSLENRKDLRDLADQIDTQTIFFVSLKPSYQIATDP